MIRAVTVLVSFLLSQAQADSFFSDRSRGWHWYEVMPIPEEDEKRDNDKNKKQGETDDSQNSHPRTPTELVKAYREELESKLHRAWIDPTPKNVLSYQEMQKDMMDRSALFATTWMKNVYETPSLDHTLVSPVNQQGRFLQIDLQKKQTASLIQNLSQEYGLFFFFSSECPYCHQFAPIVKRFSEEHGWDVIAISVDGGANAEFPNAEMDNGVFETWGVKVLPSLFAVNPQTQEAIPVAHGLTSLDEIENRIVALGGDKK